MSFFEDVINKVWDKAKVVGGNDSSIWRKDECGAWIDRSFYGSRDSQYGCGIDHITPESRGGRDSLYNLRPLQWQNNASKQDDKLVCHVTASRRDNF